MFGMKLLLTFILFLLKILRNLWSLEKCLSIRFRKYLPIFVATSLPKGGLNQIIFLFRCFFVLGLLLLLLLLLSLLSLLVLAVVLLSLLDRHPWLEGPIK